MNINNTALVTYSSSISFRSFQALIYESPIIFLVLNYSSDNSLARGPWTWEPRTFSRFGLHLFDYFFMTNSSLYHLFSAVVVIFPHTMWVLSSFACLLAFLALPLRSLAECGILPGWGHHWESL